MPRRLAGRCTGPAGDRSRKLAPMNVLVVLPTYNEAENIDRVLRRIREPLAEATVLVVDDGSPDGTADMAEIAGQGARQHRGAAPARQVRPRAAPTAPGSAGASTGASTPASRWTPTCPTSPRRSPGWWPPCRTGASWSSAPGTCPGGSSPTGPGTAGCCPGGATSTPRPCSAWAWPTRPRGSGPTRPRVLAPHRPRPDPGRRLRVPDRDDLPGQAGRGQVVEVPIRFVDRVEGESKMSTFIVVEALGLVTWWGLQRLVERTRSRSGRPTRDVSPLPMTGTGPDPGGRRRALHHRRGHGRPPVRGLHHRGGRHRDRGAGQGPVGPAAT